VLGKPASNDCQACGLMYDAAKFFPKEYEEDETEVRMWFVKPNGSSRKVVVALARPPVWFEMHVVDESGMTTIVE
jgi:hypothetical protein